MKIKFKKDKMCELCGEKYNENFYECPRCKTLNSGANIETLSRPTQYFSFFSYIYLIIIYLFGSIGVPSLIYSLIAALTQNTTITPIYYNLSLFIGYFCILVFSYFVIKNYISYIYKSFLKLRPYLIGIITAFIIFGITTLYSYLLMQWFPKESNPVSNNNAIIINILIKYSPVFSFFNLVIFAPLCEELAFRVGLFGIVNRINPFIAIFVSSLVFGLIHLDFGSTTLYYEFATFPSYFISGVILSFVYYKYGLACSLTAHIFNNLLAFIFFFI